jgi:acyl-CoA-binding protein
MVTNMTTEELELYINEGFISNYKNSKRAINKAKKNFPKSVKYLMRNPESIKNLTTRAIENGNFEETHKNILKIISRAKSEEDIKYLRRDMQTGKAQLSRLIPLYKKLEAGDSEGMKPGQVKNLLKRISKGQSSKKIEEQIKWIDTVAKQAIDKKAKEIREREGVDDEW